jgi:hypothetical protein
MSHNILVVDQLWLWFIEGQSNEPDTVITSFPSHQGTNSIMADYYASKVLKEQNRDTVSSTPELIARIMSCCCSTLNRHRDMPSTQFLQFFESAIGDAVSVSVFLTNFFFAISDAKTTQEEQETKQYRLFRRTAKKLYALHEKYPGYQQKSSLYLKHLLDLLEESKLLKDIQDVSDEIKMIKAVLEDEQKVLESPSFKKLFKDSRTFSAVREMIYDIYRNFQNMEDHAKGVEDGVRVI